MNNRKLALIFLIAGLIALAWLLGLETAGILSAVVVPVGIGDEKFVSGEPLTLSITEEAAPGLLRNEIDSRIVKIRPMATPVDQISRMAGSRKSGSMVVEYYSVDTRPSETTLTGRFLSSTSGRANNGFCSASLEAERPEIFEPTETVMVPNVTGKINGKPAGALVLYVTERSADGDLTVVAVNNTNAQGDFVVPDLPEGSRLVRMGRAAGELDVQTAQYEALPTKKRNNCQIFKAQVEQSTYQKIANKEVGWTFSDQEEMAIFDMRLGMEKNFLFGHCCRVYDPVKREEIMLTGGIWEQAGKDFELPEGEIYFDSLVDLCQTAFTGGVGSSKKILVAGSELINRLHHIEHTRVLSGTDTMTRWGLDFTEIVTKFGRLYVVLSEVFDACGHASDGLIIDPEYLTKYCHVPFNAERLDLRSSGTRNTDAVVVTEASCLVLRYPDAHVRVTTRRSAD